MRIFSGFSRNTKVLLAFEPMWAVFGGLIFYYAPLYMKEQGLTEIQMGIINTAGLFVAFICHLLAAPITNRLGRKRTTLIFDLVSWSIPMIIWAFARSFWAFFAAAAINSIVRIVYVSWMCLLAEDSEASTRSRMYGFLYIINYATGLFTPLSGLLIMRYGTVPVLKVLYVAGFFSMTLMFLLRNKFARETAVGLELMKRHNGISFLDSMKSNLLIIRKVTRDKTIILAGLIYVFTSFILSMNFFQILFMKEYLGFTSSELSLVPACGAVINALMFLFVLPRLGRYREEKMLSVFLVVSAAGSLLFILVPHGNLILLLMVTSVIAVGGFLTQTYRDTVFMNKLGEHEKADMFAAVQTVTTLICIPSGYIAGYFYSISPVLPFLTIFILFSVTAFISVSLHQLQVRNDAGKVVTIDMNQKISAQPQKSFPSTDSLPEPDLEHVAIVFRDLALSASEAILRHYRQPGEVRMKADASPVTDADEEANDLIVAGLKREFPGIPVLAEESADDPARMNSKWLFVVDPLDGTKEFIKRNGEFTVNIALLENNMPIAGHIRIPVTGQFYSAIHGKGAWFCDEGVYPGLHQGTNNDPDSCKPQRISVSARTTGLIMAVSRSHPSQELDRLMKHESISRTIVSGSSLKGCLIARGIADAYYRFGRTMEWDTAAMQCIVEEAGGVMRQMDDSPMTYNKVVPENPIGFYVLNRLENRLHGDH